MSRLTRRPSVPSYPPDGIFYKLVPYFKWFLTSRGDWSFWADVGSNCDYQEWGIMQVSRWNIWHSQNDIRATREGPNDQTTWGEGTQLVYYTWYGEVYNNI